MKTNFEPQAALIQDASSALIEKMGVNRASQFWTLLGFGKNDYGKIRKQLFAKETIKALAKKIKAFENKNK
ncbi:MAG: hypothetical protein Q8N55_01300 [bacterium]|nr:hypothetical protein [bacterium]